MNIWFWCIYTILSDTTMDNHCTWVIISVSMIVQSQLIHVNICHIMLLYVNIVWLVDIVDNSMGIYGYTCRYIMVKSAAIIICMKVSVMWGLNRKQLWDGFHIWELVEHWGYGVWSLTSKPVASHGYEFNYVSDHCDSNYSCMTPSKQIFLTFLTEGEGLVDMCGWHWLSDAVESGLIFPVSWLWIMADTQRQVLWPVAIGNVWQLRGVWLQVKS